jgi:hypothetical protein
MRTSSTYGWTSLTLGLLLLLLAETLQKREHHIRTINSTTRLSKASSHLRPWLRNCFLPTRRPHQTPRPHRSHRQLQTTQTLDDQPPPPDSITTVARSAQNQCSPSFGLGIHRRSTGVPPRRLFRPRHFHLMRSHRHQLLNTWSGRTSNLVSSMSPPPRSPRSKRANL